MTHSISTSLHRIQNIIIKPAEILVNENGEFAYLNICFIDQEGKEVYQVHTFGKRGMKVTRKKVKK